MKKDKLNIYCLKDKIDRSGTVLELKRRLMNALRLHQSDMKTASNMVDSTHKLEVDEYSSNSSLRNSDLLLNNIQLNYYHEGYFSHYLPKILLLYMKV